MRRRTCLVFLSVCIWRTVVNRCVDCLSDRSTPPPPPDKPPRSLLPFVSRLGSGPSLVGQIGSEVRINASFPKKIPSGSVLRQEKGVWPRGGGGGRGHDLWEGRRGYDLGRGQRAGAWPRGEAEGVWPRGLSGGVLTSCWLCVFGTVSPRLTADGDDDGSLSVNRQVTQNSTFALRCPARAVPAPQITWYKDGHEIDALASDRIQSVAHTFLNSMHLITSTFYVIYWLLPCSPFPSAGYNRRVVTHTHTRVVS